jgi:hypothetical protein
MQRMIINRLALVTVALIFSLALFTREGIRNASPCQMTPGCISADKDVRGTVINTRQGFPVAYKVTQTFRPTKNANYKETKITQEGISITAIALNVLFWFALLDLLLRIRTAILDKFRPDTADIEAPVPPKKPAI